MALRDAGPYFAWVERESPSAAAIKVASEFVGGIGDRPWLAPSTPIPELSDQPHYELRSAHLKVADGTTVRVWFRHTYATDAVDVLDVTSLS